MSELNTYYIPTRSGNSCLCYLKSEADEVIADLEESHKMEVEQLLMEIEEIVKGAISMFRLSDNCRGLDLKSPLGRIANTAFKHWCFVESIQNKNQQLQEDKERLLHNNHHLLDEVERLKADYKEACDRLQTANLIKDEKLAEARHEKYKRCLAMAKWCHDKWTMSLGWDPADGHTADFFLHHKKWEKRWLALAEKFKEAK